MQNAPVIGARRTETSFLGLIPVRLERAAGTFSHLLIREPLNRAARRRCFWEALN